MKILIIGTTGSGKTTLAQKLSTELNIPHIELDSLYWDPGWNKVAAAAFRKKVEREINRESWIADGNYSISRDLLWSSADVAIWLDFSMLATLKNLMRRTTKNLRMKKELWPGCTETFRQQFFSKNSIFFYFAKSFWKRKKTYPKLLAAYPNLRVIRIRYPKELAQLRLKDDRRLESADASDANIGCKEGN